MSFIPYGRQHINKSDIQAVVNVLQSDFITQGPMVPHFEESVATYCGARYSVAVNSATSALHIACLALGLGPGDYLWTSPITFVASANCGLYCGAKVDFVDIDPRTYNLSVENLETKLIRAQKIGKLPKIVIPVHFAGQSCDMKGIKRLADRFGFRIIEDASHAIGGKYAEEPIGNCRYSDISVLSFHPVKIITTGEGGMALTNNSNLADKMARLRSHGITRKTSEFLNTSEGNWYYEQIDLGFNYRMTDIQAALGISQINRLDEFIDRRNKIAAQYDKELRDINVFRPHIEINCRSSFHLYVIRINNDDIDFTRTKLFEYLHKKNVGANLHYIPLYKHPYYKQHYELDTNFPESERYYEEAISIPMYPGLKTNQVRYIASVINTLFRCKLY